MTLRTHLESIAAGATSPRRGNVLPASALEQDHILHHQLGSLAQKTARAFAHLGTRTGVTAPSGLLPPLP